MQKVSKKVCQLKSHVEHIKKKDLKIRFRYDLVVVLVYAGATNKGSYK
jgi:hypothetical protein